MKSKIAILSLLLTGAAVSASAQTKEHYYSEKAKDNIFISVGVEHRDVSTLTTLIMALDMP